MTKMHAPDFGTAVPVGDGPDIRGMRQQRRTLRNCSQQRRGRSWLRRRRERLGWKRDGMLRGAIGQCEAGKLVLGVACGKTAQTVIAARLAAERVAADTRYKGGHASKPLLVARQQPAARPPEGSQRVLTRSARARLEAIYDEIPPSPRLDREPTAAGPNRPP